MATTLQSQQLRGLALPAIRTAGGYFVSKQPDDVAWGDLIITLFTPIGSRLMRRQFGSALSTLVFDPSDATLQTDITTVIQAAAALWAPMVTIRGVTTTLNGKQVGVTVSFSRADNTSQVLNSPTVYVSKADVIGLLAGANR